MTFVKRATKVVKRVLEKALSLVHISEITFFLLENGLILLSLKLEEEYHAKVIMSYISFMDQEKAFD